MTDDAREQLKLRVMRHEGEVKTRGRHMPYTDTVGKVTIGHGRNLTDKGLSDDEAAFLLENDLSESISECQTALPWVLNLSDARQGVLYEMAYNMGLGGLLTFRATLSLIMRGEYVTAAANMLKSKWAQQVGNRAVTLARIMETGRA